MEKQRDKAARRQQRKIEKELPAGHMPEPDLNGGSGDAAPIDRTAGELFNG